MRSYRASRGQPTAWIGRIERFAEIGVFISFPLFGASLALSERARQIDAALLFVASLALLFCCRLLAELRNGSLPALESHWGGFGSSLGGWRLSPALVYLVATACLGGFLLGALIFLPRDTKGQPPDVASAPPSLSAATAETPAATTRVLAPPAPDVAPPED